MTSFGAGQGGLSIKGLGLVGRCEYAVGSNVAPGERREEECMGILLRRACRSGTGVCTVTASRRRMAESRSATRFVAPSTTTGAPFAVPDCSPSHSDKKTPNRGHATCDDGTSPRGATRLRLWIRNRRT